MSRVIKTVSADGSASAAAGLSSADVKTLIEGNAEFTFIKSYEITQNISSFTIPAGDADQDKYDKFKFVCKGNRWVQNGQPYFWQGGNTISVTNWYGSGRNTYNSSDAYFGGQVNQSAGNFTMELTYQWVNGYILYDGYVGMTMQGGYWEEHRRFNAIGNTGAGTHATSNGLQMRNFYLGTGTGLGGSWDDKVYLYGAKKVSS